jgi:hypothetical protein
LTLPLVANDELVAVAWLSTITGLSADMVATQLPPSATADGKPSDWVKRGLGFATVAVVGGNPDMFLPVGRPVIQVDTWAKVGGSNMPPWGVANRLGQTIVRATWDRVTIARPLSITAHGVRYPNAAVQSAYVLSSPRRITDDAGDFARYTLDLQLHWITPGDTYA